MERALASRMVDAGDVYAPPPAGDGQGGEAGSYPADWTKVFAAQPCRLQITGKRLASEKQVAASSQAVVNYQIATRKGLAIKPSYRIRIQSLGNRDFEVLGIKASTDEVQRLIDVTEIQV